MKTKRYDVAITVWTVVGMMLVIMMMLFGAGCFGKANATQVEQEPVVKYVEVQKEQMFDTSIIEAQWCSGLDYGTVRMVGGWWYDEHMIEDEQGNVWVIEQDVEPNDFLLVWIVDNHTPKDYTDDAIVKVWREAY